MVEPQGLSELAEVIDPVARRFADAGHRIYLVGGIVRDLVLADSTGASHSTSGSGSAGGLKPSDIDLTTDALPGEIKALVGPMAEAVWAQGERFGTIGATVGGRAIEITTHRAEAYDPTSRKPVVTFGRDLDEDLSRRDFTINAMAIELPSRTVHDPYGGVADLGAKLLRTPLSPEVSFTDDPLRILRAARFIARFDLTPSAELAVAATDLADRLSIVSVERIADELERLLAVVDPRAGLQFLVDNRILSIVLGEADMALVVELGSAVAEPVVRRAGLLWPYGESAQQLLKHLRYSRAETARTTRLLDSAGQALAADPIGPPTVRAIAARVGLEDLPLVTSLVGHIANHDARFDPARGPAFAAACDQLAEQEDLADLGSPLTGQAIIETLGIEPGPAVGDAQKFLINQRLERGPLTEPEAKELLLAWWKDR